MKFNVDRETSGDPVSRIVNAERPRFCQACSFFTDGLEHVELPPPAIYKPVELWTGKQVYSVMLRPNRKCQVTASAWGHARIACWCDGRWRLPAMALQNTRSAGQFNSFHEN